MTTSPPRRVLKSLLTFLALIIIASATAGPIQAATPKAPVLLSEATSTRAIALESVSLTGEPFPLTQNIPFSSDPRTRIAVFATNVELLAGEGVNAFTAEVQDAAGKRYPLKVEHRGTVPGFPGITMFIVRLADDLSAVGDVLLGIHLHGMSSNRVRIGIGTVGGGPTNDVGAVPTPAPLTPPQADPPLTPDPYAPGTATDADTVRFLEQASWGPTASEVARVKAMGFRAYLDEQFVLPDLQNAGKGSNYPDLVFPAEDGSACPTTNPAVPNYNQTVCTRDNFTMYPNSQRSKRSSLCCEPLLQLGDVGQAA